MRILARTLAITSIAALGAMMPQVALAATQDKQPIHDFHTGDPVTGAFSKLDRTATAIATKIRTTATAGDAVTMWYVIFNNPAACNGGACGEDDIFVNPDLPNFEQINAVGISVVFGGDGAVVNPGGRLDLSGGLAEGAVPSGAGQVVIGDPDDGAFVPGPVTGLVDAQAAEVHIVLQDHGPAHEDPALLAEQLSSFMGACNPACDDFQFAVHMP